MKTVPAPLQTHANQNVTSFATGWKIVRKDGKIIRVNTAGKDITADFAFPAPFAEGTQTYTASEGVSRSNIESDAEMNVDNLNILGSFDGIQFDDKELRRGLFNGAQVFVFIFNHQAPGDGAIRFFRAKLGEVRVTQKGIFHAEMRSFIEVFRRTLGELYSKDCRADLGDSRCRIPIIPDTVQRSTAYLLGDFVKVVQPVPLTVTNPGAESGTTGWTNEIGNLDAGDAQVTPNSGSAYFAGGNAEAETKARQDISIPTAQEAAVDAGTMEVRLTWFQQSVDEATDDQAEMTVRFLDGSLVQIGAESSAGLTANVGGWVQRQHIVAIPANTRTLRVAMHMLRQTGPDNDAFIDDIEVDLFSTSPLQEDFGLRIFKVTTAGTTAAIQPDYDLTVGNTTTDGTVVFTAEEAWMRHIEVTAVDSAEPRRKFTVTELTPNSGGVTPGRDFFPDNSMNQGTVVFETGDNSGNGLEVRKFDADDGVTITQDIELYEDLPFDIQVGDKARIFRGCDKTKTACVTIFDNAENAVAEWYVPGPDSFGKYPDAR